MPGHGGAVDLGTGPPARADAVLALGVDVGTSNTKVLLVAVDPAVAGGVQVLAGAAAPTAAGADEVVAAVARLVGDVVGQGPRPPDVVGIASMAETGVPLDDQLAPLTPWLRWDGRRGPEAADRLAAELGRDDLMAATGVRPSAKVPLATWAWLRTSQPQVWSRVHRWAGAAEVVCLAMTGRVATDHTLAGRTMAYRLPGPDGTLPAAFDRDLLAAVGLAPHQLPDVVADEPAGRVRPGVFTAAGLTAGTPVVVAGHDHAVGAYAAGVREPGDRADSVGTTEAVMTVVADRPDPVAVAAEGMSLVRTASGRYDAVLAGSPSAGAMAAWWFDVMCGGRPAADLLAELTLVPVEPTGVVVLPYLSGRQAPAPDPLAAVQVLGAGARHRRGHLTRALLEGLALQARWMLAVQWTVAADVPTPRRVGAAVSAVAAPGPVVVLGAPVRSSPEWLAVKADVTPGSLRVVDTAEPVACGAALLAAERAGVLPAATVRLPSRPLLPAPGLPAGAYDAMFETFVAAALAARPRGKVRP